MTQARNDTVRLRLTTLEKQDWTKAAGGSRKLSEWIRSVCNAAAQPTVRSSMTDLMISPESIDEALSPEARRPVRVKTLVVPNAKPKIVGDAIERSLGPDASIGAYDRHKAAVERGLQDSGLAAQAEQTAGGSGEEPAARESRATPRGKDQAHRESRSLPATDAGGDDLSSGGRDGAGSAAKAAGPASEQCARWMHHRPGVYCGSCKRVIGK